MPLLGNIGKRRGLAYTAVPNHVLKELLKLDGIEFNGRKLVIEKTKTPPKLTTRKSKQTFVQTQSAAIIFKMETFEPVPPSQQ